MKEKKTTKIIIVVLVIIILILAVLVGLLATDTISFTKEANNNNHQTNTKEDEKENKQEAKLLTNDEAQEVIKKSYNKTIRDFFNVTTYCGEYATMSETESQYFPNKYGMSYGFNYVKSANFKSFKELDDYLKQYATQNLLNDNDRYNKTNNITSPETGEIVPTYVEKDGALYCNSWGKGGPGIGDYQENESRFEVSNVAKELITGKIYAVYYDQISNTKNTLTIEVEVIKENDKWLLNHYKQVD